MNTVENIESQGIGLHARQGFPEPELPDIQEPVAEPQNRYIHIYTATRILCGLLIITNMAMDWAVYAELKDDCAEPIKKRFLAVTIIGTLLTVAQIVNIFYQVKANCKEEYQVLEPLNYMDGRSEAMLVLMFVEVPQLLLLREHSNCDGTDRCSTGGSGATAEFPSKLKVRLACAVIGLLSCHFRFSLSRTLPRFGKRGVEDEYKVLKLKKTKLLKTIIVFDQVLPKILKMFGLDFICLCRKCKLPMFCGDCVCDHLTPIWRWGYFIIECWICRFTYCPKRERGEVWCVNRARMLRRRPGFLCLNKEDPYFFGIYYPYFFMLALFLFLGFLETTVCNLPMSTKKLKPVHEVLLFGYGLILNKI